MVYARTTITGTTTAKLSSGANVTALNGSVDVIANSIQQATADMQGGSGSIGVAVTRIEGLVELTDTLLAEIGDGATVTASQVRVSAGDLDAGTAARRNATAVLTGGSGGLVATTVIEARATINSTTKARIGRAVVTAVTPCWWSPTSTRTPTPAPTPGRAA